MDDDIIDMSKFELLKQTCSSIWTSIWNIIVRFGRVFWIGVGVSFIISLTMGILIGHYGVSNECTEAPGTYETDGKVIVILVILEPNFPNMS